MEKTEQPPCPLKTNLESAPSKDAKPLTIPADKKLPVSVPFAKWKHFKEAFSPEIVYEAIRCNGQTARSCIDPFGGSGTTALACQLAGVVPTTIEVNPYLADLIEAKLLLYDTERLVRDLATLLRLADKVDPSRQLEQLPKTFVEPGVKGRWLFDQDVARRILSIVLACNALEFESHSRLFLVLLGGILVTLSNATINGKGRRYRSGWNKKRRHAGEVDALLTQSASTALQELRCFEHRASTAYTLIRGDCRQQLHGRGPFDLAVFSPPYPNSFDYTDVYNIELWMLGYLSETKENQVLRKSTLSSHVQIKRDFTPAPEGSQQLDDVLGRLNTKSDRLWSRDIPDMLGGYFAELLHILGSLRSSLNLGGSIWIVVGDSSYAGVAVGVANILEELARARDFEVRRNQTLRVMRKSAQQGGQIHLDEKLLVLGRG